MNVKKLIAVATGTLFLGSIAYAHNSTMLVDDMMSSSGTMSGVNNDPNGTASGNIGSMNGPNDMSNSNDMSNNNSAGMSGMNSSNNSMNTDDGSADTATGDNDY